MFFFLVLSFLPFFSLITDRLSSTQPNHLISTNNNKFDPSHLYAQPSKPKSKPQRTQINFLTITDQQPSTSASYASVQPKTSKISEKFKNSVHSSSQESNSSHSNHSGASGATLPLDEPIEYADA